MKLSEYYRFNIYLKIIVLKYIFIYKDKDKDNLLLQKKILTING